MYRCGPSFTSVFRRFNCCLVRLLLSSTEDLAEFIEVDFAVAILVCPSEVLVNLFDRLRVVEVGLVVRVNSNISVPFVGRGWFVHRLQA